MLLSKRKIWYSNKLFIFFKFSSNVDESCSLSGLFLFLSVSYLTLFSYLHPFNNGIILNHLGNPEVDIAAMVLFFFSISCNINSTISYFPNFEAK